jgi:ABC-type molybdate transport system substrate-binding protein
MLPLVLVVALARASAPPLTVSAAVRLTEALKEAATAERAAAGTPIVFNVAGSNTLARRIGSGAPADVFISADEVVVLEQRRVVQPASRAEWRETAGPMPQAAS